MKTLVRTTLCYFILSSPAFLYAEPEEDMKVCFVEQVWKNPEDPASHCKKGDIIFVRTTSTKPPYDKSEFLARACILESIRYIGHDTYCEYRGKLLEVVRHKRR